MRFTRTMLPGDEIRWELVHIGSRIDLSCSSPQKVYFALRWGRGASEDVPPATLTDLQVSSFLLMEVLSYTVQI